ncbi:PAAR domain-containing protein [Psychrobacter alimentarius]|uniref:PAAR domain-containing protein n=1 Tax=Psychrobacter alimentarius TaxID=261164 RepID=UPI003FD489F1
MAAYITVGAKTSHGGTVLTGSPHTTHNGIPVARKGDQVMCKKCKKMTVIVSGDASFIVDGAPIARGGDVTSCGAKLIANQQAFAESDFSVGSITQAAPLVFPKSDSDSLFAGLITSDDSNAVYSGHFDAGTKVSPQLAIFNETSSATEYTETEKKAIQDAVIEQNRMLNNTKNTLTRWNSDDQQEFKQAFGDVKDIEKAREIKLSQVDKMLNLNENLTFDNFKDVGSSSQVLGGGYLASDPRVGAYVTPKDATHSINTGKAFFKDPYTGKPINKSTNARLLTHEFSHFDDIAGTKDFFNNIKTGEFYDNGKSVYGTTASKKLAQDRPDLALKHADSFSYYASGMIKNTY